MEARATTRLDDAVGCSTGKKGDVLSVDFASEKAIATARIVEGRETLPLLEAIGRVSAKRVSSGIDLPVFANSAMDGYAIRTQDLIGKGPWTLPVSGRLAAGAERVPRLGAGTVVRIMTGAPIPDGANCVVMQEHCERLDDSVLIHEKPVRGRNIRLPGEDLCRIATLVEQGVLLSPRHVALLAACGRADVSLFAKVRIGLISTGSELVEPGNPLATGQIYNSNRYYLKARLDRPWIKIVDYGILADNPQKIQITLQKAARECDVVITTGGVSAGEEDHVLDVLNREAAEIDVLKVAMRPGKPVKVGRLGSAIYFGLPGNPYACAITFMQIAWPAIRKTGGLAPREDNQIFGVADFTYQRKSGRKEYLPVTWSGSDPNGLPLVERLGRGSSASLHPFALARAIAMVPEQAAVIQPGDMLAMEPVDF